VAEIAISIKNATECRLYLVVTISQNEAEFLGSIRLYVPIIIHQHNATAATAPPGPAKKRTKKSAAKSMLRMRSSQDQTTNQKPLVCIRRTLA
jgi:hypothetical protein